jgi:hypothetical protein
MQPCNYIQDGSTAGGLKYPEKYNDYEGFSFDGVNGPYYEFLNLKNGGIYDGGEFACYEDRRRCN